MMLLKSKYKENFIRQNENKVPVNYAL